MKSRVLKRSPKSDILDISSAEGVYLKDKAGNKYLDMASNSMICNLGYGNKEIIKTINDSYHKLSYCHNGNFTHENQELLAHKLNSLLKEDYYVYFCSSGSETIEAASRLAYLYQSSIGKKERNKFLAFSESYHGSSLGALSLTGAPAVRDNWRNFTANYKYINRYPTEIEIAENLTDEIAGFFVEPLSSNATGTIEFPSETLEILYKKLKSKNQLIIFDEISTSIGRTGTNFFFTQQFLSFSPDIICSSKGIGVGYFNIGAVLVKKEIAEKLLNHGKSMLGHSYNGHPVGTSVGLKVLEILERDNYLLQNKVSSNYLNTNVNEIISDFEGITFNHKGLLSSIHVDKDKFDIKEIYNSLKTEGIVTVPSSKNHITLSPPYIIKKNEIDLFLSKLFKVLKNEEIKYERSST